MVSTSVALKADVQTCTSNRPTVQLYGTQRHNTHDVLAVSAGRRDVHRTRKRKTKAKFFELDTKIWNRSLLCP